jgi:hypothetical protein
MVDLIYLNQECRPVPRLFSGKIIIQAKDSKKSKGLILQVR